MLTNNPSWVALASLQDGWLDGEGKAPPADGVAWLASEVERAVGLGLAPPAVYPTFTGGVRMEWTACARDMSLDVDLATRVGSWHELNTASDQEAELLLDLRDSRALAWVACRVRGAP